jgi:tyrosinase
MNETSPSTTTLSPQLSSSSSQSITTTTQPLLQQQQTMSNQQEVEENTESYDSESYASDYSTDDEDEYSDDGDEGNTSSTIISIKIRKNVSHLSKQEADIFIDAIKQMKQNGKFDYYARIHLDLATKTEQSKMDNVLKIHGGAQYLPWHRWFIHQFEQELGVAIPYWDWTTISDVIWSDDFLGGDGNEIGIVTSGSFAFSSGWKLRYSDHTELKRFLNGRQSSILRQLPSMDQIQFALSAETYEEFNTRVENLNNAVNEWVGGTMASLSSANDPLFYLVHSFIDKLWVKWQTMHCSVPHFAPSRVMHNLMDFDGALNPATPYQVLEHISMWYDFDNLHIGAPSQRAPTTSTVTVADQQNINTSATTTIQNYEIKQPPTTETVVPSEAPSVTPSAPPLTPSISNDTLSDLKPNNNVINTEAKVGTVRERIAQMQNIIPTKPLLATNINFNPVPNPVPNPVVYTPVSLPPTVEQLPTDIHTTTMISNPPSPTKSESRSPTSPKPLPQIPFSLLNKRKHSLPMASQQRDPSPSYRRSSLPANSLGNADMNEQFLHNLQNTQMYPDPGRDVVPPYVRVVGRNSPTLPPRPRQPMSYPYANGTQQPQHPMQTHYNLPPPPIDVTPFLPYQVATVSQSCYMEPPAVHQPPYANKLDEIHDTHLYNLPPYVQTDLYSDLIEPKQCSLLGSYPCHCKQREAIRRDAAMGQQPMQNSYPIITHQQTPPYVSQHNVMQQSMFLPPPI